MGKARNLSVLLAADGQVEDAKIDGVSSSKLSGALPALDGSSLTGVAPTKTTIETLGIAASSITGALPAISGASLTSLPSQTENDFTDTLKTKLDAIEASATADQSKSDIEALGIAASSITGALPAISGANLTGITGTTTRIHAFSKSANKLIWTHTASSLSLKDGNNSDSYLAVEIGSSDQVYSINSDGKLICTYTQENINGNN